MSIRGFLKKLFGGEVQSTKPPASELIRTRSPGRKNRSRNARYETEILSVDSLRFVGQAARSPNKQWVVGWTDRLPATNPRAGSKDGSLVLIDYSDDQIVLHLKSFYRPMEAAVADNGTFLFNDANFGDRLSADVRAFDVGGQQIFQRMFAANAYNLAISRCGRYGVVQTANARGEDGNLLELYDLRVGATLFSREPETGWADGYVFTVHDSGELARLTVVHSDGGRFKYSPSGDFLDKDVYRKARLDGGSVESRIRGAKEALKGDPANPAVAAQVLASLEAALGGLGGEQRDHLASGLRTKGEALEVLGRQVEAVAAYEQAVAIDPKIGVAKRLGALKKTFG